MNSYTFRDRYGRDVEIKYDIKSVSNAVLQIFKANAPVRTGTLKGNIRIEELTNGFSIVCDIYYMPYTTEKWGYHSGWKKTLVNPNEGWWQESFNTALQFLSQVYGKEFKRVS